MPDVPDVTEPQLRESLQSWVDKATTDPRYAQHLAARLQDIAKGDGTLEDLGADLARSPDELTKLKTPSGMSPNRDINDYLATTRVTMELTGHWEETTVPPPPMGTSGPICVTPLRPPGGK